MAIKIQNIIEAVEDNGLKCLVHAPAGAGKTVLCATAGAPTIIISNESGLLSIKGAIENGMLPKKVLKLVKIIQVKTISDLEEAYDLFADSEEKICDWVCLDSISEIAEVILADAKKECKDPRQAYGRLADDMLDLLKSFRDLPNYNVLMTCKQARQVDDDSGRVSFVPLLAGARLTKEISYLFDEVFALRVEKDEDGDEYRTLQTNRDGKYECKDRSGHLEMFEDPSLFHIVKKLKAVHMIFENEKEEIEDEQESETKDETEEKESCETESEMIAEKNMYFEHSESGDVDFVEEGSDFSFYEEDGSWEKISKVRYTKMLKQIEDEQKEDDSI